MDSSWDSDRLNMENLDISTDSEVQFRQCFTEGHDEPSADDKDSCAGHARFLEDYVEAESDVDNEPP